MACFEWIVPCVPLMGCILIRLNSSNDRTIPLVRLNALRNRVTFFSEKEETESEQNWDILSLNFLICHLDCEYVLQLVVFPKNSALCYSVLA